MTFCFQISPHVNVFRSCSATIYIYFLIYVCIVIAIFGYWIESVQWSRVRARACARRWASSVHRLHTPCTVFFRYRMAVTTGPTDRRCLSRLNREITIRTPGVVFVAGKRLKSKSFSTYTVNDAVVVSTDTRRVPVRNLDLNRIRSCDTHICSSSLVFGFRT